MEYFFFITILLNYCFYIAFPSNCLFQKNLIFFISRSIRNNIII